MRKNWAIQNNNDNVYDDDDDDDLTLNKKLEF